MTTKSTKFPLANSRSATLSAGVSQSKVVTKPRVTAARRGPSVLSQAQPPPTKRVPLRRSTSTPLEPRTRNSGSRSAATALQQHPVDSAGTRNISKNHSRHHPAPGGAPRCASPSSRRFDKHGVRRSLSPASYRKHNSSYFRAETNGIPPLQMAKVERSLTMSSDDRGVTSTPHAATARVSPYNERTTSVDPSRSASPIRSGIGGLPPAPPASPRQQSSTSVRRNERNESVPQVHSTELCTDLSSLVAVCDGDGETAPSVSPSTPDVVPSFPSIATLMNGVFPNGTPQLKYLIPQELRDLQTRTLESTSEESNKPQRSMILTSSFNATYLSSAAADCIGSGSLGGVRKLFAATRAFIDSQVSAFQKVCEAVENNMSDITAARLCDASTHYMIGGGTQETRELFKKALRNILNSGSPMCLVLPSGSAGHPLLHPSVRLDTLCAMQHAHPFGEFLDPLIPVAFVGLTSNEAVTAAHRCLSRWSGGKVSTLPSKPAASGGLNVIKGGNILALCGASSDKGFLSATKASGVIICAASNSAIKSVQGGALLPSSLDLVFEKLPSTENISTSSAVTALSSIVGTTNASRAVCSLSLLLLRLRVYFEGGNETDVIIAAAKTVYRRYVTEPSMHVIATIREELAVALCGGKPIDECEELAVSAVSKHFNGVQSVVVSKLSEVCSVEQAQASCMLLASQREAHRLLRGDALLYRRHTALGVHLLSVSAETLVRALLASVPPEGQLALAFDSAENTALEKMAPPTSPSNAAVTRTVRNAMRAIHPTHPAWSTQLSSLPYLSKESKIPESAALLFCAEAEQRVQEVVRRCCRNAPFDAADAGRLAAQCSADVSRQVRAIESAIFSRNVEKTVACLFGSPPPSNSDVQLPSEFYEGPLMGVVESVAIREVNCAEDHRLRQVLECETRTLRRSVLRCARSRTSLRTAAAFCASTFLHLLRASIARLCRRQKSVEPRRVHQEEVAGFRDHLTNLLLKRTDSPTRHRQTTPSPLRRSSTAVQLLVSVSPSPVRCASASPHESPKIPRRSSLCQESPQLSNDSTSYYTSTWEGLISYIGMYSGRGPTDVFSAVGKSGMSKSALSRSTLYNVLRPLRRLVGVIPVNKMLIEAIIDELMLQHDNFNGDPEGAFNGTIDSFNITDPNDIRSILPDEVLCADPLLRTDEADDEVDSCEPLSEVFATYNTSSDVLPVLLNSIVALSDSKFSSVGTQRRAAMRFVRALWQNSSGDASEARLARQTYAHLVDSAKQLSLCHSGMLPRDATPSPQRTASPEGPIVLRAPLDWPPRLKFVLIVPPTAGDNPEGIPQCALRFDSHGSTCVICKSDGNPEANVLSPAAWSNVVAVEESTGGCVCIGVQPGEYTALVCNAGGRSKLRLIDSAGNTPEGGDVRALAQPVQHEALSIPSIGRYISSNKALGPLSSVHWTLLPQVVITVKRNGPISLNITVQGSEGSFALLRCNPRRHASQFDGYEADPDSYRVTQIGVTGAGKQRDKRDGAELLAVATAEIIGPFGDLASATIPLTGIPSQAEHFVVVPHVPHATSRVVVSAQADVRCSLLRATDTNAHSVQCSPPQGALPQFAVLCSVQCAATLFVQCAEVAGVAWFLHNPFGEQVACCSSDCGIASARVHLSPGLYILTGTPSDTAVINDTGSIMFSASVVSNACTIMCLDESSAHIYNSSWDYEGPLAAPTFYKNPQFYLTTCGSVPERVTLSLEVGPTEGGVPPCGILVTERPDSLGLLRDPCLKSRCPIAASKLATRQTQVEFDLHPGCKYTVTMFMSRASSAGFSILAKSCKGGNISFKPTEEWAFQERTDASWGVEETGDEETDEVCDSDLLRIAGLKESDMSPPLFLVTADDPHSTYVSLAAFNLGNLRIQLSPLDNECDDWSACDPPSTEKGYSAPHDTESSIFDELNQVAMRLATGKSSNTQSKRYVVSCTSDIVDIEGSFELSVFSSSQCYVRKLNVAKSSNVFKNLSQ